MIVEDRVGAGFDTGGEFAVRTDRVVVVGRPDQRNAVDGRVVAQYRQRLETEPAAQ
ncbi:hypothetical protein [Haloterrigena salifodinae]|uniref:hypothetical protein n=1 Tax=Haloterrigena salifodinae TaxID=2675099 RepID=UPI002010FF89|nr:hypothetical protein [Haloterrigena salifodinae]